MKHWIFIWAMAVTLLAACSEDDNTVQTADPFLPVADLEIPTRQLSGTDITIHGSGFAEGCAIILQQNKGGRYATEIIEQTADHITIHPTQPLEAGFYIVILQQNEREYRIGGLNVYVDELTSDDIEIYAVGDDGSGLGIFPASATLQIRGDKILALDNDAQYYGALSIGSTIYYATFIVEWRLLNGLPYSTYNLHSVGSYDMETDEQQTIFTDRQMVAMGDINGTLHVIFYNSELSPQTYSLEKWNGERFENVKTFPAGGGDLLEINGGTFVYDEAANTIYMGMRNLAGDTESAAWYFDLDNSLELTKTGGTSDVNYYFVKCDDGIYVTGYRNTAGEDEDEHYEAYIFKPTNPGNWNFSTENKQVFDNAMFTNPVYDPVRNVIYGFNDNETLVTYDIAAQAFSGGIWVNSGLYGIIPINQNN